jgi:nucleoside-diphosphate-sugar epimerase
LVIGGTGFVGRRVVEELMRAGGEVLLLHRGENEPESLAECEHLHADRAQFASVAADVRSFGPDVAIDAYALTRADAEAVVPHLPDVPLIVLSSMDVYRAYDFLRAGEEGQSTPIDESAPLRTSRFPYRGAGTGLDDYEKIDVEQVYREHGGIVLRLGVVFGEHDWQRREEFVLRRVRAGRTRIPVGPGTWLWSRLYVGDAATAVQAAAARPDPGAIYNVADPATWSMHGWARHILGAAGHEAELVPVPEHVLPADLALMASQAQPMLFDCSRIVQELGWRARPFEEAVELSVRWHLDHPPADDTDFEADDRALAATSDHTERTV